MDNKIAIEYRKKLPKSNNFNIRELREMPQYFGWVNYVIPLTLIGLKLWIIK